MKRAFLPLSITATAGVLLALTLAGGAGASLICPLGITDPAYCHQARPTVATKPASDVTATSAGLNAAINPNGARTSYSFQYGKDTSYASHTTVRFLGGDSSVHHVSAKITGLTPRTTYHFRIVATNVGGVSVGKDLTFRTKGRKPHPRRRHGSHPAGTIKVK
jgi:hypothetical protein